jgi:beta-galactosidase
MATVNFDGRSFQIDGRRIWIVSGSVPHAQTPRALWADRLHAARKAGLNTVETSVVWSAVEPRAGHYAFEGEHDIRAFIELASEFGLHVILRVGPYVGRGLDLGGLPVWLLSQAEIKLRASNPVFLEATSRYFAALADQIRDLQVTATGTGGALLAVQVEHEWTCGSDEAGIYLRDLSRYLREAGITVPAINANNLWQGAEGQIDGWVGDEGMFPLVRQLGFVRPGQPRMIAEFGGGRLPRIGEDAPEATDPYDLQRRLGESLAAGAQYNLVPFAAPAFHGFAAGSAIDGPNRLLAPGDQAAAPVDCAGAPTVSYGPVRRISSFASRFARVLAASDPEYRPVVQDPSADHQGPIVTHMNGNQGSIAFLFSPKSGKSLTGQRVELLRPNGTPLGVHLGKQRVSWCLFDVHLNGHAVLDYCGLNVLDAVGELMVCFGPGGTVGELAINGTPIEIQVPKGRKPAVERLEGVTVVVVSEEVVDQTYFGDGAVYVGVAGVTRTGEPIPGDKPYVTVLPEGKPKSTSATKPASDPKIALGPWSAADNDAHIAGDSPRYAGIDGPADLASLGTPYGYGWYRAAIKQSATKKVHLASPGLGDRAVLLVDGEPAGVLGEGPGAAPELSVSLKKGDRTLVLLVENAGRRIDGTDNGETKGLANGIIEVSAIKAGKPEIVEGDPILPLKHDTPIMHVRENDAAFPERLVWKIMHRKKSPLHIALGPVPVRGVLLINEAFVRVLETGETVQHHPRRGHAQPGQQHDRVRPDGRAPSRTCRCRNSAPRWATCSRSWKAATT